MNFNEPFYWNSQARQRKGHLREIAYQQNIVSILREELKELRALREELVKLRARREE